MRFPFFRNRDSVKNGILISIRRTGDGFHPGLFKKFAVALYKLSSKERDVILLRYFQSMSDQEIAELYHVSRSAIYRRRSNGLKKLKTVLKERN